MEIITWIQNNPKIAIILISFLATLLITIVNYFLTDRKKMKEISERQKALREEMKQYKNDPAKMMEINKKMMEDFPEQMKQSLKPLIITLIPLLLLFSWIRSIFAETIIAKTWIWYYIASSLFFSIVLRKIFKMQ